MDSLHPRFPALALDGKRIAGTSLAIVLHVTVLMLLMLPAQMRPAPTLIEPPPLVVVPEFIPPKPVTPPETRLAPIAPVTPPKPVPMTPVEQVAPVDSTPSLVDVYVEPSDAIEPVESFELPQPPAFAQISADRAPAPPYPVQARRRGIGGLVMLRVRVDASGRPLEVSVETSSGSRLLDEAARKFVLARWHFVPATQDGRAIEAQALVPISFVIDR